MPRLAHDFSALRGLRQPTVEDPWRVLVSGCLTGLPCGADGTDYGMGAKLAELLALPTVRVIPFCPEEHALGTPRGTPDIEAGSSGFAVLDGRARVLDDKGEDVTKGMIAGGKAMAELAEREKVDLAILTDMSAACGSQVISDGCRLVEDRAYQKGVGVATALLLRQGVCVVSQRDFRTLGILRQRLEPGYVADLAAVDHHHHPWVLENL